MSSNIQPLVPGELYHIYNRAIGKDLLFQEEQDHFEWINYFKKYAHPLTELYSYCLLPNHYHLLLRIKEDAPVLSFSKAMSDAANAYCKCYNKKYQRRGSLFIRPFKRKVIEDNHQLAWTCWYIHRNPMHHGYTNDWASWKFSSYQAYFTEKPTILNRDFILDFFGGRDGLQRHHALNANEPVVNVIAIE